jgi:hypothetical protein
MTHRRARAVAPFAGLVALVVGAGALPAQTDPPPPRRNPPKSVSDLLGGGRDWKGPTDPAPPPDARSGPPASGAGAETTALNVAIAALSKRIAAGRIFSLPDPRTLKSQDELLLLGGEYRHLYEMMRERLYVADPPPETAGGQAIEEFHARWGSLAPKLWKGSRVEGRISVPEWAPVVEPVRRWPCPITAEIPERVAEGLLSGPAWACLSDAFFGDLARHETRVNDILVQARRNALAPLDAAFGELDEWMQRTEALRRVTPESQELRREFAVRLHAVWLAGVTARRDELIRIRDAKLETPFQRFLGYAPAVVRPDEGSAAALLVPESRELRANVGSGHARVRVVAPAAPNDDAGLARQLHEIHESLRAVERVVQLAERREMRDFAIQLSVDLSADPMLENPRASPRFAAAMRQKETELVQRRPARVQERKQALEVSRKSLLQRIAAR